MQESGLTIYWENRIWPSTHLCNSATYYNGEPRKLTLNDVQSPFLVLAIGSTLSSLIFILEWMRYLLT